MTTSIDRTLHTFWPLLIWTVLPNLTFYLIVQGFHRTYATGAACQQRTLTPPDTWSCPIWDLQMFFCWDHWHSIIHYTSLWHLSPTWLFTDFDVVTEYRFPWGICNGCGMPTGDANASGHLVLSHFGTCMCSNVETNLSWTCLVSWLLNFEHSSVLLFCFNNVSVGISHLVFYCDLVYKLRRVKCEAKFVTPGSKIVKRLRCRKYDPVIIERTIGLVLCLSTALRRSFLKHCTPTNKPWWGLYDGTCSNKAPILVPSDCKSGLLGPLTWARFQTGGEYYSGGCLYMFLIFWFYHLTYLCNNLYCLSALVGCWSSVFIRRVIYNFLNVCPFVYTAFAVSGKVEILLTGKHTSWVAIVTPTDRPKSVSNHCVIEVFSSVFVL